MNNKEPLQEPPKKPSAHFEERVNEEDLIRDSRSLSKNRKLFVLDGVRHTSKLSEYNALKDHHLQGFFYSRGIRRHLFQIGLITKDGYIIEDKRPKLFDNYQIMPIESNLYEDQIKEKRGNQKQANVQQSSRAKSSKALNANKNNRIIIRSNPKIFSKLPLQQPKKEPEGSKNEGKSGQNQNQMKEKQNNNNVNANETKIPPNEIKKNSIKNLEEEKKEGNLQPLTKQDLNKWFEKCIDKIEKDPDVDNEQKEKLLKTKEKIIKNNKNEVSGENK